MPPLQSETGSAASPSAIRDPAKQYVRSRSRAAQRRGGDQRRRGRRKSQKAPLAIENLGSLSGRQGGSAAPRREGQRAPPRPARPTDRPQHRKENTPRPPAAAARTSRPPRPTPRWPPHPARPAAPALPHPSGRTQSRPGHQRGPRRTPRPRRSSGDAGRRGLQSRARWEVPDAALTHLRLPSRPRLRLLLPRLRCSQPPPLSAALDRKDGGEKPHPVLAAAPRNEPPLLRPTPLRRHAQLRSVQSRL